MTRLTWRFWKLFAKARRGGTYGRRQNLVSAMELSTIESLESRALLVGNASGAITGTAFIDADRDGHLDAKPMDAKNETKMPGVTLTLSGRTSTGVAVANLKVKTKADGTFTYQNVLPGNYQIQAKPIDNPGVVAAPLILRNIAVAGGQTATRNLAFTNQISPQLLSVRQFRTNATRPATFGFAAPGTVDTNVNFRENNRPTLANGEPGTIDVGKNAPSQVIDLAGVFDDPDMTNSMIRFKTTVGTTNRDINVTLLDTDAPQTVANFFNYVTGNDYDNTFFHRLAETTPTQKFVLQGGGFKFNDAANTITRIDKDEPVANEFDGTNRSNVRGTIAMAKLGGNPNSATNEFFFNLGNNVGTSPNGLNFQNGGFTVFARVDTASLDELDALAATPIRDQSNTDSALNEIPLNGYTGTNDAANFLTTAAPANFVRLNDVQIIKRDEFLKYSFPADTVTFKHNTNPALVTVTLKDNRLFLDFANSLALTGSADITVRATDRFGATLDTKFTINVANTLPEATVTLASLDPSGTPLLPSETRPSAGGKVQANVTTSDDDGDPVQVTYRWTVNNQVQAETGPILNLAAVTPTPVPGDSVSVRVTPNDGTVDGVPMNVSTFINTPPIVFNSTLQLSSTASTDETLTANLTVLDNNNDAMTLTYVWKVNGITIPSETKTHNNVQSGADSDSLDLSIIGNGNVGDIITVEVTLTDGKDFGTPVMGTATVVNDAPAGTVTINDTTPTEDQLLTATNTLSDADGVGTITYTWKRADDVGFTTGVTTVGMGETFMPGDAEVGKFLRVTASYTDGESKSESVNSNVTSAVMNVNDVPTGTVTIDDTTPTEDQLLMASNTLSDADGLGTITYTWSRATDAGFTTGVTIVGTGETFTPGDAEMGKFLRVTASYMDGQGASESVSSDVTSAVINVNDTPTLPNGDPAAISLAKNPADQVFDLAGIFSDPDFTDSLIRFKTTVGTTDRDIDVTLLDTQAPKTVANFFNYITSDRYDNTFFHRLAETSPVQKFVLQGGGFIFNDTANTITRIEKDEPVANEFDGTNRSNLRGTIAMAKSGGDPNSATNEFFFNLNNNSANLNNQNGGFTVFARVDVASLDELDALAATTIRDQSLTNSALNEIPLNGYPGPNDDLAFASTATPGNFVRLNDVEIIRRDEFLTYSIEGNTNSALVTATIENNRLFLAYSNTLTGTAAITVRATDKSGAMRDTTFQVEVRNTAPAGAVTIDHPVPTEDQLLTASNTLSDADGLGTIAYTWERATNAEFTTAVTTVGTGETFTPGDAEVGLFLRVPASYTDGGGKSESVRSAVTSPVTNINDAPFGQVTIDNTTPAKDQLLTASNTLLDADGLGTITYTWERATDAGFTTGVTNVVTGATFTPGDAEVGLFLRVTASYTDLRGTFESVSSDVTAAVTAT